MVVFLAKITNRENVDYILSKQEFTHLDIYNFETEIKVGSPIFLVFSGDKSKINWEQGVVGFGHISRTPYDKGYNSSNRRYFKIDIKPEFVLEHPLSPKFTKLHPKFQNELYDVPYVGANHFPNQAIAKTSGKNAEALFHLFEDVEPGSTSSFDFDFLRKKNSATIKDEFRDFLSTKNKASTVSSYINALDKIPEFLHGINVNCPFVWDEDVDIRLLEEVASFVKSESLKENGGRLSSYVPKSHWNNGWFYSGVNNFIKFLDNFATDKISKPVSRNSVTNLPKPFILLSGISGTGKTRFVREQANMAAKLFNLSEGNNYCLVPVRPDWHEPSDLLGYISRINGTRYISTDFLKFTLKAICAAVESCDGTEIQWKSTDKIPPFWLCLDEMNLAPVEQYFADFLSILETQNRSEHGYTSDPILKPGLLKQLALSEIEPEKNSLVALWDELFDGTDFDNQEVLCEYFKIHGIPLPINLIVAGTVNMDETTHGFSRKVIDRALTIDFQEFYPNDYDTFFRGQLEPKLLWFPQRTNSDEMDLPAVDKNNEKSKSTEFLKTVNSILKNTPFELGYRALNELLLSVTCFNPKTNEELQAVWDDYLMQKILPRIEGDSQKLKFLDGNDSGSPSSRYLSDAEREFGKGSLLHNLYNVLESELLKDIWGDKQNLHKRPDLLRETEEPIECRSKKKLLWMLRRLKANHFTDFWV